MNSSIRLSKLHIDFKILTSDQLMMPVRLRMRGWVIDADDSRLYERNIQSVSWTVCDIIVM